MSKEVIRVGLAMNISEETGFAVVTDVTKHHVTFINLTTWQETKRDFDLLSLALQTGTNAVTIVPGKQVIEYIHDEVKKQLDVIRTKKQELADEEARLNLLLGHKNSCRAYYEKQ